MADANNPPSAYASHFLLNVPYQMSLRQMRTTANGVLLAELDFTPTITIGAFTRRDGTQVPEIITNECTMWFEEPGHAKHDPKDWAFADCLSTMQENIAFNATRKNKPWQWEIDGTLLVPTTVKTPEGAPQAAAAPQTAPTATTPQAAPVGPQVAPTAPSKGYNGPLTKDAFNLLKDCRDQVMSLERATDDQIQGWTSTLFIQMCNAGAHRDYLRYKGLHLAGSKPADGSESEDGMPF